MDENERKIINQIAGDLNKLMSLVLSYLNFFSPNSEKINYPIFSNKYKYAFSKDPKEDIMNDEKIKEKVKIYFDEFNNELLLLNEHLKEINKYFKSNFDFSIGYKNNNELINLYNESKNLRSKNILFKSRIQNNEFIYLIFKYMVNIVECSIIEDLLKSEIKTSYAFKGKNKYIIQNKQIDIKEEIKNYIKYTLKSYMDFNYDSKGNITIKYFPFLIIINISHLEDNLYYLNKKIHIIINICNQKKENQDLLLIDKIKILFENRIAFIINLFFEEKKLSIKKPNPISQPNLLDLIKYFLNYLYNYNNLMKKKCALCNKIGKYSFKEKSFFPPYYKLFKAYKIPTDNNLGFNEKENLFYHEDCFKIISNSSV